VLRRHGFPVTHHRNPRPVEDQWNSYQFLVELKPVLELAVIEKLLPVVGGDYDYRIVANTQTVQLYQETSESGVPKADLSVVGGAQLIEIFGPPVDRPATKIYSIDEPAKLFSLSKGAFTLGLQKHGAERLGS